MNTERKGKVLGMLLAALVSVSLAACRGWETPQRLWVADTGHRVSDPQIVLDDKGNGLAVWTLDDNRVMAGRYTRKGGWETARPVDADRSGGSVSPPQIVMNSNGHALAVWRQSDGTHDTIRANHYAPLSGWGTAQVIDAGGGGPISEPQIAMDPAGNALVVWTQSNGTRGNIWANHYSPAGRWGMAQMIGTGSAQLAMDPNGNGLAVWSQAGSIWAKRYTPAGGWGIARLVAAENSYSFGELAFSVGNPVIAMDSNGNAIAAWTTTLGLKYAIGVNHYTPDGGWGMVQSRGSSIKPIYGPSIFMAPNGNGFLMTYHWGLYWTDRYTPEKGWEKLGLFEENASVEIVSNLEIALDAKGNGLAVWVQDERGYYHNNVWVRRYMAQSGWGKPWPIMPNFAGDSSLSTYLAMNSAGQALVVWVQSHDGGERYTVGSSYFTATKDLVPLRGWEPLDRLVLRSGEYKDEPIPDIAVDPMGNGVAVWRQTTDHGDNIWGSTLTMAR